MNKVQSFLDSWDLPYDKQTVLGLLKSCDLPYDKRGAMTLLGFLAPGMLTGTVALSIHDRYIMPEHGIGWANTFFLAWSSTCLVSGSCLAMKAQEHDWDVKTPRPAPAVTTSAPQGPGAIADPWN